MVISKYYIPGYVTLDNASYEIKGEKQSRTWQTALAYYHEKVRRTSDSISSGLLFL